MKIKLNRDGFLGPIRALDENDCNKLIEDYQNLIVRLLKRDKFSIVDQEYSKTQKLEVY